MGSILFCGRGDGDALNYFPGNVITCTGIYNHEDFLLVRSKKTLKERALIPVILRLLKEDRFAELRRSPLALELLYTILKDNPTVATDIDFLHTKVVEHMTWRNFSNVLNKDNSIYHGQ
jgi:hypothetical protein